MVSRLKKYPGIFKNYGKYKNQNVKREILSNQRRHLSEMAPVPKKLGLIREKMEEFVTWYDEFTGMDEVREAQKRVLEDEQKFKRSQEQRRHVLNELNDVKSRITDVHTELDSTNRGDERYLTLITQEHTLLREERLVLEKFTLAEEEERNSFSALSSSVKLSHEKERAQSERTKYWSIIGSILGTVIGILGTSINNYFKMNELKELIKNSSDKILIESVNSYMESNEKLFEKLKQNEKSLADGTFGNETWKNINSKLSSLESSFKKIEENNVIAVKNNADDYMTPVSVQETFTGPMKREFTQTNLLLITIAVLSILMPIITKYT